MDDAIHETWRPIPGYEGFYDVSDLGRIRSLPRHGIRLANLCWGTPPENWADKVRDGAANVGVLRGEAKPTAKLTWAIAADCRRRYAAGESQAALAREFGVHKTAVQQVVTGKTWRTDGLVTS